MDFLRLGQPLDRSSAAAHRKTRMLKKLNRRVWQCPAGFRGRAAQVFAVESPVIELEQVGNTALTMQGSAQLLNYRGRVLASQVRDDERRAGVIGQSQSDFGCPDFAGINWHVSEVLSYVSPALWSLGVQALA